MVEVVGRGEGPTTSHVGLTGEDENMLVGPSVGRREESGEGGGEGERNGVDGEEGKEKEERGEEKESWDQLSHFSLLFLSRWEPQSFQFGFVD